MCSSLFVAELATYIFCLNIRHKFGTKSNAPRTADPRPKHNFVGFFKAINNCAPLQTFFKLQLAEEAPLHLPARPHGRNMWTLNKDQVRICGGLVMAGLAWGSCKARLKSELGGRMIPPYTLTMLYLQSLQSCFGGTDPTTADTPWCQALRTKSWKHLSPLRRQLSKQGTTLRAYRAPKQSLLVCREQIHHRLQLLWSPGSQVRFFADDSSLSA